MRYPINEDQRMFEHLEGLVVEARERFHSRGDAVGSLELSGRALELATSMDQGTFLTLDPPSMASFIAMTSTDDRVIELVASALESQAEVADGSGLFIEATARRDQAAAVRELVSPLHEN